MDARRKTSIRLSEDARNGFARVAKGDFGGKSPFGGENPFEKGSPGGHAPPGTPAKRDIPKDHDFDKKAVKPLVQTLWAMSVALGHALTAHRAFSRLKSSTFSPDGLLGGRGYVMPVKDIRSNLFEACEQLSALCDTLHDEINASHWKPKIAELEKVDMDEVERLLGDAEDWIDDPEKQTNEDEEDVEKRPWSKAKKQRFEKDHDFSSKLPAGGDPETLPASGPHPTSPDHPANKQMKQASAFYNQPFKQSGLDFHTEVPLSALALPLSYDRRNAHYDPSVLGIDPSTLADMEEEERHEALFESLMRASDMAEAVVGAFQEDLPQADRGVIQKAAKDLSQVARKLGHHKTAGSPGEVWAPKVVSVGGVPIEEHVRREGNSSVNPDSLSGPRVNHLDRADSDQTGPGGSYNRDEPPVSDEWGEQGGVSGEPMSQNKGDSYIYPAAWGPKSARSSVPDSNTDSTPTQGWDFGIGDGNGDDAHGQGAGGYGEKNPGSPHDGEYGVYGPSAQLPDDPGGKTHDDESDSNPAIENSVSESGHMGLPVEASFGHPDNLRALGIATYAAVPGTSSYVTEEELLARREARLLTRADLGLPPTGEKSLLPNDTDEPVARSDYFDGDKGNDFNGVIHRAETELPGDESKSVYDYGKDGGPNVMDRVEHGDQPYVKWDDNTHEMRPDYIYQRDPIQGPYPKDM